MSTFKRYVLSWLYTDIDGRKQTRKEPLGVPACEAVERYRHKIHANELLVGGATITHVKLYEVEVEETWNLIADQDAIL